MPSYIVCYRIEQKYKLISTLIQEYIETDRSNDPEINKLKEAYEFLDENYKELYRELEKLGKHIITSTYRIDNVDSTAEQLTNKILNLLPERVKKKLEIWIFEIGRDSYHYP